MRTPLGFETLLSILGTLIQLVYAQQEQAPLRIEATSTVPSLISASPRRSLTIHDLLSVNSVGGAIGSSQVQISPNGKWVVYQMRKTLLEQNQYVFDLWLADTSGQSQPKQLTDNAPATSAYANLTPRWSSDSQTIAYFSTRAGGNQIWLIRLDDLKEEQLTSVEGLRAVPDISLTGAISNFQWSPDDQSIAFTAGSSAGEKAHPNRGVEVDANWVPNVRSPEAGLGGTAPGPSFLCEVDLKTRKVQILTKSELNVLSFDWSPNGQRLVISASEDTIPGNYMRADIYMVNRLTGEAHSLLKQPGWEKDPIWSPDGEWITLASQRGVEDWKYTTVATVIPASGGRPIYLTEEFLKDTGSSPGNLHWSADSKEIYFEASYHMTAHLFRTPRKGGSTVKVSSDDHYYSEFSYSEGEKMAAFKVQRVTEPADIYISALSPFKPVKLTELNPQLRGITRAQVDLLSWRSKDNKWHVHGVLVKPPDYQPGKKYPLLVFNEGGPTMVRMLYDLTTQYPIQVLAAKGYLILAPNTRGRSGYGDAFSRAITTEMGHVVNPFQDMMAGVDLLVERGIADPDRLGVMGFSYGAYLTAYTITQTDRFKAASVNEAAVDMPYQIFLAAGKPWAMRLFHDLHGFGSPYDSVELQSMMRQSANYNTQNIRSAVLLEYGINNWAPSHGRIFFQGLQYVGVPSEFIVYPRTGHGLEEPLLLKDSMERNLAWFDYWLLGKPYTDAAKQARYDLWHKTRAAMKE